MKYVSRLSAFICQILLLSCTKIDYIKKLTLLRPSPIKQFSVSKTIHIYKTIVILVKILIKIIIYVHFFYICEKFSSIFSYSNKWKLTTEITLNRKKH